MGEQKRLAIFIDLANLNGSVSTLFNGSADQKIKVDYAKLVNMVSLGWDVVIKNIYIGIKKDDAPAVKFIRYLEHSGFKVIPKEPKQINLGNGEVTYKADLDVDLTLGASEAVWRRDCDGVAIFSGDSDFKPIGDLLKRCRIEFIVVSSQGSISKEMREIADRLIFIENLPLNEIITK